MRDMKPMPTADSTVHPPQTVQAVRTLYRQAASPAFFDQLGAELKLHFHHGVYTLVVVVWLTIVQRPHPKGTLLAVVQEAVRQLPPGWVRRLCKRLREGSPSCHTGGYNQARRKLPQEEVVERVSDRIFEQLVAGAPEARPGWGRRLFLLDGSTLLLPNTPELAAAYPPTSNQHGLSHGPVMRVLVAHELIAGLAMRPEWGPVNGPGR
jgi:hypothetical protein